MELVLSNFQIHRSRQRWRSEGRPPTSRATATRASLPGLRAMRWLTENKPDGVSFVTFKQPRGTNSLVRLEVDEPRHRKRSGARQNLYRMDGETFEAFGRGVPEPSPSSLPSPHFPGFRASALPDRGEPHRRRRFFPVRLRPRGDRHRRPVRALKKTRRGGYPQVGDTAGIGAGPAGDTTEAVASGPRWKRRRRRGMMWRSLRVTWGSFLTRSTMSPRERWSMSKPCVP